MPYVTFAMQRNLLFLSLVELGFVLFSPLARADLLQDIKKRGEIIIATEARYPPFEFLEGGKIAGYSTDLLESALNGIPGVAARRLDVPFQGILPGLDAQKFDYVVTAITATKERAVRYRLSLPIADASLAILIRKDDATIRTAEDLAGKAVGSQAGSAQLQGLQVYSGELRAKSDGKGIEDVKTYVDFTEAYADLAAGRISAVVNSLPNLLYVAKQRPDAFEVVPGTFGPKKYFVWAGRNDPSSSTLEALVDERLSELNRSGEMAKLQVKWFGYVMPVPADKLPAPEF
jgi:polar amino acid transport system substrate-binding protein